jgi:hypothetical protein
MCYGQCFLDRNLSALGDDDAGRPVTTVKYQGESNLFVYQVNETKFTLFGREAEKVNPPQISYSFSSDISIFHPPC